MKRVCIGFTLVLLLVCFVLTLTGCNTDQMGETAAEGHRRHIRLIRLQKQQMMEDIDAFLMLDKPSVRAERTLP